MRLNLNTSVKLRFNLTNQQAAEIKKMYSQIVKNIRRQKSELSNTATGYLRNLQLSHLEDSIAQELLNINKQLNTSIPTNMTKVCEAVVADNQKWAKKFGIQARLAHVPTDVVNSIASGQLYEGNWSLSKSLWKDYQSKRSDINKIVAEGIAQNKSTYDIAKDLEQYVDPAATKPWDWGKVYPGVAKVVDYNAQRLARTMVSHAYQQSLVVSCKSNPFVTGFKWHASNSDRVCPICQDRDGKVYSKDELPLDHPNGMCIFEVYIPYTDKQINDRLAAWVAGAEDPAIEEYATALGYLT